MKRNILIILLTCAWCFSGGAQAKPVWSDEYKCQTLIDLNWWKLSNADKEPFGVNGMWGEFSLNLRAGIPSEDECKKVLGLKVQESISVPKEKPAIQTSKKSELIAGLSDECRAYFNKHSTTDQPYAAFAAAPKGACGGTHDYPDATTARNDALINCQKHAADCKIISEKSPPLPAKVVNEPLTDFNENKPKYSLCLQSLDQAKTDFTSLTLYTKEVQEAKRRGLSVDDCRLELGLAPLTTQTSNNSESPTGNESICTDALNYDKTDFARTTHFSTRKAIKAIKSEGYTVNSCRQALGLPPLTTQTSDSSSAVTSLAANLLCSTALNNLKNDWDPAKPFEAKVQEAKRRGLSVDDCRREIGMAPLPSDADASNLPKCTGYLHNCQMTYTYANGNKYVGEFKDGKRDGRGTYTFADGDKYVGEYKDNKYNGQGTYTWKDGSKYVGQWADGVPTAGGLHTSAQGLALEDVKYTYYNNGILKSADVLTYEVSAAKDPIAASVLCSTALNFSKNDWDPASEVKVQEAKRRGLSVDDCRQALGLAPTQLSSAQTLETRQALDDVESYLKTGSYSLDPFVVVKKLTAVKTALNSNDLNELTRLRDDLKAYVETDVGYQKFLQNRVEAAKEAEKLLADKTLESAKQLISLSEDFVRKNVLSEKAPILIPLVETLKSALSDGAIPKIGEASSQLEQKLKSFGIDVPVTLQASTTPVEPEQAPTIEVATPKKAEPVPVTETSDTKIASLEPANPPPVAEQQQPLKRVALVIGNDTYQSVPPLENAGRDAKIIASALTDIGFSKVTLLSNLDHTAMLNALRSFSDEAELADWAMIYYAGHGIEVGGVNYLIPTDAVLKRDRDVDIEAIDLAKVMSVTEGARKLRVVILDACRDNPFVKQMARTVASRSIGRGLGQIEPEAGSLVVYAAKHGQVAYDGDTGMNGPFAASLVRRLKTPKLDIRRMFDLVRDDVLNLTGKKQQPFIYGSLSGNEDFYFSVK